jgi:O-antigen ligase
LFAAGIGDAGVAAEGVWRARGPYGSPNNLALLLGRVVPALAAFALWGSGSRRRLYTLAAIVVLPALVATFSRGALLAGLPATALLLAWIAWRSGRLRRGPGVLAPAVAVAGLAVTVAGVAVAFGRTDRIRVFSGSGSGARRSR